MSEMTETGDRQAIVTTFSNPSIQEETDNEVQADCVATVNMLSQRDAWISLDAPQCSEEELRQELAHYGLANDPQTARFCQFVAIATNFASLTFVERIQRLPELIDSINKLLEEIQRDIREIADMGNVFQELVHCFTSLVLTTQHNMKMMLPDLYNAADYMKIIADALGSDTQEQLGEEDRKDIRDAMQGMCSGVQRLFELSKSSRERSEKLDQDIKQLQQTVQHKRIIVEGRIDFGEHFKIVSQVIAGIGSYYAANALTANNMQLLNRVPGLIQVGCRIYPPLRPILIGVVLGGVAISSITMLVKHFWLKHNHRALEVLVLIFDHLMRLSEANDHFTMYMRNSEASTNNVLVNIKTLQEHITSPSVRMRTMNKAVCTRAVKATSEMIDSIEKVLAIDVSK